MNIAPCPLSPLESMVPKNALVTLPGFWPAAPKSWRRRESTLAQNGRLKPLRINTYRKRWGVRFFSTNWFVSRVSGSPRRGLGEGGPTLKRSNIQTCQRKSFRMHSYEIAYTLTLLESHSYRKTGGGLIVNQNQPLPTTPSYLAEYKDVTYVSIIYARRLLAGAVRALEPLRERAQPPRTCSRASGRSLYRSGPRLLF